MGLEPIKDNWANVLGIGAAVIDKGKEVAIGGTDVLGEAAKIGVAGSAVGSLSMGLDILFTAFEKHKATANPKFTANPGPKNHE